MSTAYDVADFFIDVALDDPENHLTNMRVNKLLYFAQGWSLARRGIPLFEDDFCAWTYGPVVPEVYHKLKISGKEKIRGVMNDNYMSNISAEEKRILLDVLYEYNRYSTGGLVELSHKQGGPWANAIKSGEGTKITKTAIKDYFGSLPPLQEFRLRVPQDAIVGHRDAATGNYVLPKEWDDESL